MLIICSILLIAVFRISYILRGSYKIKVSRMTKILAFPVVKQDMAEPKLLVMYYINIVLDILGIILLHFDHIYRYYALEWGYTVYNSILIGYLVEQIIKIRREETKLTTKSVASMISKSVCIVFVWVYPLARLALLQN